MRLDEYLKQMKVKCSQKWNALLPEITEKNSVRITQSLKAAYKLKPGHKRDRNEKEDKVYWTLRLLLEQKPMDDTLIAQSIVSNTEMITNLGWDLNTWISKVRDIRMGHSWDSCGYAADFVLRWCQSQLNLNKTKITA